MRGLSGYKRRLLLRRHYGEGCSACPLAGQLLPELVAGELEEACVEIWATKEQALLLQPPGGAGPLSGSDWQTILGDFQKAKASLVLQLKMKTSYIRSLPWLLCALAHTDYGGCPPPCSCDIEGLA